MSIYTCLSTVHKVHVGLLSNCVCVLLLLRGCQCDLGLIDQTTAMENGIERHFTKALHVASHFTTFLHSK